MSEPTITTSDGVQLDIRWWHAALPARAVVVLAHGLSDSKDNPGVVRVAEHLAGRGYDVLAYDARGHRGSGGLCTLGDLERLDVAAAVSLARDRTECVVAVGASMGAIAALRYAATSPDVAGVVSVSSPALWRLPNNARSALATVMTRTAPGRVLAARYWRVRLTAEWNNPEPPLSLAARIEVPVAVVHGRRDRFIRPSEAAELARAARRSSLHLVAGMGHAFDAAAAPAIARAVDWVLAGDLPATSLNS